MEKNKILAVFNTCGLSGKDNTDYYKLAINNLLAQNQEGVRVVISSCMNSEEHRNSLRDTFGDKISYNFIDEIFPVNVTFNHSVREGVKYFGEFEDYLYIDSGCVFNGADAIKTLYTLHKSGPYAMTAALTDTDSGILEWFGVNPGVDTYFNAYHRRDIDNESGFFNGEDKVIPVGRTINLHIQLFSNDILQTYGNIIPDIFASYCTESTFSFLCAAIRKQFIVSKDVVVHHQISMDGPSLGFPRPEIPWQHLFRSPRSMVDIINDPKGIEAGFGYEEITEVMLHDPEQFDENHFCKNDDLKTFIKDNIYLGKESLDYDAIDSTFIR